MHLKTDILYAGRNTSMNKTYDPYYHGDPRYGYNPSYAPYYPTDVNDVEPEMKAYKPKATIKGSPKKARTSIYR